MSAICAPSQPAAVVECRSQQLAGAQQPYVGRAVASSRHQMLNQLIITTVHGQVCAQTPVHKVHALYLCVCRKRIPDQAAAVSISYLGIGSASMANLHSLPPAAVLRKWLKHTSKVMEAAAKHPGQVSTTLGNAQTQLKMCMAGSAGYPAQERARLAIDIEERQDLKPWQAAACVCLNKLAGPQH